MSVPKFKRNESPMQFLDTARELEIYTIQRMRKFPEAVYVSDNEGTHRLIAVNLQQRKISE